MPADLWIRLPASLAAELKAWQAAGASVCTALARIDKLDVESLHRGWPSRHNAHLPRTTSDCSAIESPRPRQADASGPSPFHLPAALPPIQTNFKTSAASASPDTPPFTPQDSIIGDDVGLISTSSHDKISLEHVNTVLATKVRRASESIVVTGTPSPTMSPIPRRVSNDSTDNTDEQFDEAAWDIFLRSYEAELEHLRTETLVRFRHIGKSVDRLWLDLKSDSMKPMLKSASAEFVTWWQKMNDKAQEYEKEVRMLEVPQLELVSFQRASQGLSI